VVGVVGKVVEASRGRRTSKIATLQRVPWGTRQAWVSRHEASKISEAGR